MKLYHYTSPQHLEYLLGSGVLLTTESNIGAPPGRGWSPEGEHVGPDVVWLTDLEGPAGSGITNGPGNKGSVRATVDVPDADALHWPEWARAQGIDQGWYDALARDNFPERWWVVAREIPWTEWVEITEPSTSKPGRNEPCPCGSKRKFKFCHFGQGLPPSILWRQRDGITVRYTADEIRARKLTLVVGPDGAIVGRNSDGELYEL